MLLRQITHDDLGCASYLVGDEGTGVAAVVDPRFEIDVYLALARYMNVRIDAIPAGLDRARPVAVICASGQRAAVAASLLQRHGAQHVIHVTDGGVWRWERSGHPIERPAPAASG